MEAAQIRAVAVQAREREEEGLRQLRARRAQLLQSYRMFLERELAELKILEDTLELASEPLPSVPPLEFEPEPAVEPDVATPEPEAAATDAEAGPEAAATSPEEEKERRAEKQEEDFGEGLDWLSSLLKEEL